ncbi:MAG: DNA-binding response regulator [Schumannella sp.]|nr:DNA-binding response regulator [Schumannella sp.]
MTTILVAEDEQRIASFLEKGLRIAGFDTMLAGDGLSALDSARRGRPDLMLLDVGLPGMDGFAVLRAFRETDATTPVIMLTARTSGADTVAGLTGGADDYVPKPFRFDELLARIRLRLRATPASASTLSYEGISLDLHSRQVSVAGRKVELSSREFALAEELLRHPDEILSREHLLSKVWGFEFDPGSNVVDVYVRYLRGKLGADRIETVRGLGYRLV